MFRPRVQFDVARCRVDLSATLSAVVVRPTDRPHSVRTAICTSHVIHVIGCMIVRCATSSVVCSRTVRAAALSLARDFLFAAPTSSSGLLLVLQLVCFRATKASVPDLAVEDEGFGTSGPLALLDLVLAVEVGAADVEGVYVARDDPAQKQDTIDEGVGVGPREEEDGQRREEDVDREQEQPVQHGDDAQACTRSGSVCC